MTPKQFVSKAKAILKEHKCQLTDPFMRDGQYKKVTPFGTIQITLSGESMASIFMRFDDDFKKEEFKKKFNTSSINLNSYKWNIHSKDKAWALDELENRLHNLLN